MRTKILLLSVIVAIAVGICGCTETNNTIQDEQTKVNTDVKSDDYMVKHIKNIEPENRDEFLYFWQSAIAFCKAVKLELKEIVI